VTCGWDRELRRSCSGLGGLAALTRWQERTVSDKSPGRYLSRSGDLRRLEAWDTAEERLTQWLNQT
jgi:hypothetical protein